MLSMLSFPSEAYSLACQGPNHELVGGLREDNGRERVRLRNIRNRLLEVVREHNWVAERPQREQPGGKRDADGEVDGEGAMLESSKLLSRQSLECDSACQGERVPVSKV